MNWYVLFTLGYKTERIAFYLNKKDGIEAFLAQYEFYYRKNDEYRIKPMFPGYVFVKTALDQQQFQSVLLNMGEEKNGLIRQLGTNQSSALSKEEIKLFEHLLDEEHVVRMSEAVLCDGKACVQKGPLKSLEHQIVKVDNHNQVAYLKLTFMKRVIKVGLKLTGKN